MKDAAQRLIQDLRWRLSSAGRKYRPDARTLKSWGVTEIPAAAPMMIWIAWFISSMFLSAGVGLPEELAFVLVPITWVGAGILVSRWARRTNQSNIISSYKRILDSNERFLLIEYTRYIRRKIRLAESDPVLGGPDEVKRLKQTHRKLRQILEKGQLSSSAVPVRSILGDEADFAESLIEVYDRPEEDYDPLAELDARLPEDIRSRLNELEDSNRAAEQRQKRQKLERQ